MNHTNSDLPGINLAEFRKASANAQRRGTRNRFIANAAFAVAGLAVLAAGVLTLKDSQPKMASMAHVTQGPNNAALN